MRALEYALMGAGIGVLALAHVHAWRGRLNAAYGHIAAGFALIDLSVILGGMPRPAEAGVAVLAALFAAAARWRARRTDRTR